MSVSIPIIRIIYLLFLLRWNPNLRCPNKKISDIYSTRQSSFSIVLIPTARPMSLNPLSFPPLPSPSIPPETSSPISSSSAIRISSSSTASTTSEEDDLAEQEWQESLAQLTLLFNLVLLPFAGKYFGRRFAYFSISPEFKAWVDCSLG